jgi:hypothetical protein
MQSNRQPQTAPQVHTFAPVRGALALVAFLAVVALSARTLPVDAAVLATLIQLVGAAGVTRAAVRVSA